jgi:spermidine/putrescine transport system ATP-binding protein
VSIRNQGAVSPARRDAHPAREPGPADPDARTGICLQQVTKRFGDTTAVDEVSLDIYRNEFFSILGPSGCGKTTLMRMIAGFERPTSGRIMLLGRPVERLPASQRDLNMVFQNYALFPYLSVYKNVAFELKVRRTPRAEIDRRVREALELVQMSDFAARKPSQLSGGQRQRVAVARALVGRPAVLLLDEPLGALDQKLRKDMQIELKRLQREVGITFVYVTHDQEEALTMSDRIAVMRSGKVLQADTPQALYDSPASVFVADFIGRTNILPATVRARQGDRLLVDAAGLGAVRAAAQTKVRLGTEVQLAIRPERISFVTSDRPAGAQNTAEGIVEDVLFVGNDNQVTVRVGDGVRLLSRVQNNDNSLRLRPADAVTIAWTPDSTRVLLPEPSADAIAHPLEREGGPLTGTQANSAKGPR